MRWQLRGAAFIAALPILAAPVEGAQRIFWAQRTSGADLVAAANSDGTDPTLIVDWPTVSDVAAIAVDSTAGDLYWVRQVAGDDAIVRSDLDGKNVATVIAWPAVSNPIALTIDADNGYLLWIEAESGNDRIRRANLDGTAATTIVSWPAVADPTAITYDPGSQRIYWAEGVFGTERIVRAEVNGANATTLVSWPQVSDPVALGVDANSGRVFWIEASFGDDALRSVSIVGGTVETLLTWPVIADPTALVVDADGGFVFWSESNVAEAQIARMTTEGTDVVTVLASPLVADPVAMALELGDRCASALDCDDLDPCTTDTCDTAVGECSNDPLVCPPGSICANGECTAGCSTSADCDDGVACSIDVCADGACTHTPDDSLCDTGLFCDAQVCDEAVGCVTAHACMPQPGNPCSDPVLCDETADTCGGCPAPAVEAVGSRYLAVTPSDQGGAPIALLVTGDCANAATACVSAYVQATCLGGERAGLPCGGDADCPKNCAMPPNEGQSCLSSADCAGGLCEGRCDAGTLGPAPVYRTAAQWATVAVRGAGIHPASIYCAHAVCDLDGTAVPSAGASARTYRWADTNGDGAVNVLDITTTVDAVKGLLSPFVTIEATNIWPCDPGFRVNVFDVTATVDAVKGFEFPCPAPCP